MRTLVLGECSEGSLYRMADPDSPTEAEFEYQVARALACLYDAYSCIVFGGTFSFEQRNCRPDLALVARDFSHWFVIEVELASHSFEGHVLPQVRAFRYGDPKPDCAGILSRELGIEFSRAETLLKFVPRSVAVVVNRQEPGWATALATHGIQMLSLTTFRTATNLEAVEVEGRLEALEVNLGFGVYSATDRSIRFAKGIQLPSGEVQVFDLSDAPGVWRAFPNAEDVWLTKLTGAPDVPDGLNVRLTKSIDGRLCLRA